MREAPGCKRCCRHARTALTPCRVLSPFFTGTTLPQVKGPDTGFIAPDDDGSSSSSAPGRLTASSARARAAGGGSSASGGGGDGGGMGNNPQMRMRQVCCHPFILAEPGDLAYGATDDRIITSCGKMRVLHRMLTRLRADGHKVLIFSQVRSAERSAVRARRPCVAVSCGRDVTSYGRTK
jgi:hypothetical protein